MFARPEGDPGIQDQRDPARWSTPRQMSTANREGATDQLFRKRRAGPLQPPIGLRWRPIHHGHYTGHSGGECQRAGQFVVFGAGRADAFESPETAGMIAEKSHSFAHAAKRRLIGFERLLRHCETEAFQLPRLALPRSGFTGQL